MGILTQAVKYLVLLPASCRMVEPKGCYNGVSRAEVQSRWFTVEMEVLTLLINFVAKQESSKTGPTDC